MFVMLVWVYVQIEWGLFNLIIIKYEIVCGSIFVGDGSVFVCIFGEQCVYLQGVLVGQVLGMLGDLGGFEGVECMVNDILQIG